MVEWKAGDRIKAVCDGGCCYRPGDIFTLEDSSSGRLQFKPRCWDDNEDYVGFIDRSSDFVEAGDGPW